MAQNVQEHQISHTLPLIAELCCSTCLTILYIKITQLAPTIVLVDTSSFFSFLFCPSGEIAWDSGDGDHAPGIVGRAINLLGVLGIPSGRARNPGQSNRQQAWVLTGPTSAAHLYRWRAKFSASWVFARSFTS